MPNAYETRPLLMMSSTLMSSASRTGSQNGSTTAASMIGSRSVRAAMADASTIGDGRWLSSAPWCSDSTATTAPRVSAQAHMSMAAAYNSVVGAPDEGARMSNRIVNTRADYNPILVDGNSAHC